MGDRPSSHTFPKKTTTSFKAFTCLYEPITWYNRCIVGSANDLPLVEVTVGIENVRGFINRKVQTHDYPKCKPSTNLVQDHDVDSENKDSIACQSVSGNNQ